MSRPSSITFEDCQALFYLPVAQAALSLGVSRPTISKVLRARGIKRWPYRRLRAEGKIDVLRHRRECLHPPVREIVPPPPPPPPPLPHLPYLPLLPANTTTACKRNPSYTNSKEEHSVKSDPLFPQPQHVTPDDETYILHLLDRPISPRPMEDHTHPFLTLAPEPVWTCNEQLSNHNYEQPGHREPAPSTSPPPPRVEQIQPESRSHTISTVRPAARAVMGAGNWSRGVFQDDGDRMAFAFLPTLPMGSSLSDEDPLNANIDDEF